MPYSTCCGTYTNMEEYGLCPECKEHCDFEIEEYDDEDEYNYYLDSNYVDRSKQINDAFEPTLEDVKNDPHFYAELVNDLMYHWVYGTRETPLMVLAKRNLTIGNEGKVV
jgi:hypothetical protein